MITETFHFYSSYVNHTVFKKLRKKYTVTKTKINHPLAYAALVVADVQEGWCNTKMFSGTANVHFLLEKEDTCALQPIFIFFIGKNDTPSILKNGCHCLEMHCHTTICMFMDDRQDCASSRRWAITVVGQ